MVRTMFKAAILATFALLAIGMLIDAQQIPEAPAGFDASSNGSVDQNVMDDASAQFQEQEAAVPNGIGPTYNDVSCVNCHQNQAVGGAAQVMELRAGHNDPGKPQWFRESRHRGDTNGSSGTFVAATAYTANGTPIPNRSLINQRAICSDAQEHLTEADYIHASRLSLGLFGDAFVEAVPDATLIALAKANGGEAILVDVLESPGTQEVGRFGWKDQHTSLLSFASDAYLNEMGVTNELNPNEATNVCQPASGVNEPNNIGDINDFTTFMRALKVPTRGPITQDVALGQALFEKIGCAGCHVETLVTAPAKTAIHGAAYVIGDAIGGKQFHPFGDYLLHNIGTGDGIVQNGPADTQYKMRTMPLWGLRTRSQFMHDAQSSTLSDAIQRHRREAADEAFRFGQLTPAQQNLVYAFLGSL
jgi:CxxC motif-containing protein (DUF1111 family)